MRRLALSVAVALWFTTPSATAASVDYGPISHKGLKSAGAASTSLKLSLQLGLIADQDGICRRGEGGEQPDLVELRQVPVAVDAAEQVRRVVLTPQRGRERVQEVRHHREGRRHASAGQRDDQRSRTPRRCSAPSGTLYNTSTGGKVALPVNTPKLPRGLSGNVDTIAGMRLTVS